MLAECVTVANESPLQEPNAARSAVSPSTSRKVPARSSREDVIRDDCTTVMRRGQLARVGRRPSAWRRPLAEFSGRTGTAGNSRCCPPHATRRTPPW